MNGTVEQGGQNSSEFYKVYNSEQLTVPQGTDLGIFIGDVRIASIEQADDTVLVSNDLYKLKFLLKLTLQDCSKFGVELSSSKTKLQMYSPPNTPVAHENLMKNSALLIIDESPIEFMNTAEHVGVKKALIETFHTSSIDLLHTTKLFILFFLLVCPGSNVVIQWLHSGWKRCMEFQCSCQVQLY